MKVENPNPLQTNIFEFDKANIFHQLVLENTMEHVLALLKKAKISEPEQVTILGKIDEAIQENKPAEDKDEVINNYIKLARNNLQMAVSSYTQATLTENKKFIADFEEVWQKLIKQKKQERLTLAEKAKKTKTEANKVAEKNEQDRDVEPSVVLKNVNIAREKGDRPYQEDEVAAFHLPELHPSWGNHIPEFMALAIQQLLKKLYTSETLHETYNKQSEQIEKKKIADFSETAGATFTLAWRDKDQLITAWVGDSPGILLFTDPKSGAITKIQSLTCPHLPNSTYEFGDQEINRARQTQKVEYNELGIARVSKIMLSRSIGDLTRGLSDTPSFSTTKIPADQDVILVLGSDGLFDCLTYDDIKETYVQAKGDEQLFVKLLREKAYKNQYGLADNITILEVKNPQVNDYFCVMDGHASKYIAEFIKKFLPEIVKELAAKPAPQEFLVQKIPETSEEKKAEAPTEKENKQTYHVGFADMFAKPANTPNEVVAVEKEKHPISKTYHYLIKFEDYKNVSGVKLLDYFIADLTLMDVDSNWQEVKSDLLKITAEIANNLSGNLKDVGKYLGVKIFDYIQSKVGWGSRNKNPLYQACMGFIAVLSLDKGNIRAIRFIGEQSSFRKKLSEVSSIEKIETYVKQQKKEFEKVEKQDQFKGIDKFFNALMQPAEKNTSQLHF